MVIHKMQSRSDIELAFYTEKKYGVTLITIREFLELEYQIASDFTNEAIRDRVWIKREVKNLDDYCLVPKSFKNELEIIQNFKKRCKTQEIVVNPT